MPIGVSEDLTAKFSEAEWLQLLHPRSLATGRYQREPGTITSPLPLNRHMYYCGGKGWTLVEVVDVPQGTIRARA
jgi:hypothetical protein